MKKNIFLIIAILLLSSFGFAESETMTLLTGKEGAMAEAPPGLYEVGRILNDGPEIKVIAPRENNNYSSPVKITILFIPNGINVVDLSKLKVEYLKLITIDITKRVLPYATKSGIKIENAKLPKGKHKIRVTIGDITGGITQETFVAKII